MVDSSIHSIHLNVPQIIRGVDRVSDWAFPEKKNVPFPVHKVSMESKSK